MSARAMAPSGGVAMGEVLLDVRNLKMYFPVTEGIVFHRTVAEVKAVDGISSAQRATAKRQRGRNAQPAPSRVRSGGWPSMGSSLAWRGRSRRGTEFSRPRV